MINDYEISQREKRRGRFESTYKRDEKVDFDLEVKSYDEKSSKNSVLVIVNIKYLIYDNKGTCQDLEKQYLRLTTMPDPSQVRPESILKKSLKMLKKKWKNKEADYNQINEQFRSIRQDMTIQHIKNDFTIKVYETHARIALESYDMDQFNQCQTQLAILYKDGLVGNEVEFAAYRIIYTALQQIKFDLRHMLKEIRPEMKDKVEIQHALKIRKIVNDNNYFQLFQLYKHAPNMGSYLIQQFLPRFRMKALQLIATAYVQGIEVRQITERLAFTSDEETVKFLKENGILIIKVFLCLGGILTENDTYLNCKESLSGFNKSKGLTASHIFNVDTNST